jgi:hypothetical protein
MRQERRRQIKALPGTVNRLSALAIDSFAACQPELSRVALDTLALRIASLHYLSNGVWSSVYQSGEQVIKVHRATATMNQNERQQYAHTRNVWGRTLGQLLGPMVVPQRYKDGLHPFGGYNVVLAKQCYVAGERLDLFRLGTCTPHEQAIEAFCARTEQGARSIRELAIGTLKADQNLGLVPDLNGLDNLRADSSGNLSLIDAEPVHPSVNHYVYDLIVQQAHVLLELVPDDARPEVVYV